MTPRSHRKLILSTPHKSWLLVIGGLIGLVVSIIIWLIPLSNNTNSIGEQQENVSTPLLSTLTALEVYDLRELLAFEADFSRNVELYTQLSRAGLEETVALFKQSQNLDYFSPNELTSVQIAIARRMAELDPKVAMIEIEIVPIIQREAFVSAIYQDWSISDLNSAVQYVKELSGWTQRVAARSLILARSDLPDSTRIAIAQAIGLEWLGAALLSEEQIETYSDSPKDAWRLVMNDDVSDELQSNLMIEIAKNWFETDSLSVIPQIIKFDAQWEENYWIAEAAIGAETAADPKGTFARATSLLEPEMDPQIVVGVRSGAVREWAKIDPLAALEAVSNLVDISDYEHYELFSALVASWSEVDPRGLLDSIAAIPASFHEQVRSQTALALTDDDRDYALSLMKDMTDGFPKILTAAELVGKWGMVDAESALEWLLTDSDIASMRYQLLDLGLMWISQANPHRAMELARHHAEDYAAEKGGLGLETHVIMSIAHQDEDLALDFLPDISEVNRWNSYREVAKILVLNQHFTKAVSLGATLPESERAALYDVVIKQWAQGSPESLFEYVGELPTRDLRSLAALSLTHNAWQGVLSDREVKSLRRFLTKEDAKILKEFQ